MNTTNTVKTFWDLTPDDIFDSCIVKIKYNNWIPEVDDMSWYSNQTQGAIKSFLRMITSMQDPYHTIKYDDGRIDVATISSGVAKGYAWAQLHTNKCGKFVEYRVYFTDKNRIQFCSKLDPIDKLVSKEQTKFTPW